MEPRTYKILIDLDMDSIQFEAYKNFMLWYWADKEKKRDSNMAPVGLYKPPE